MSNSGCYLGDAPECNYMPDCAWCISTGNQEAVAESVKKERADAD